MKIFISLLLLANQAFAGLPPTTAAGQRDTAKQTTFNFQVPDYQKTQTGGTTALLETGNLNMMDNPSFEAATALSGWTSAASLTADTSTFIPPGLQSVGASLSSYSGNILDKTVTFTSDMTGVNMEYGIWLKAALGVSTELCLRRSAVDVQCVDVVADGSWHYTFITYPGYSSGSVTMRWRTKSAATGQVNADQGYFGVWRSGSQVSQASIVAAGYIAATASCSWSRASTSLGVFGTTAACGGVTVEGNSGPGSLQTTDTDLPQFTVNNLPAGDYIVFITGGVLTSSTSTTRTLSLAVNDGATTSGTTTYITDNTTARSGLTLGIVGYFSYSGVGNRTFAVYGSASGDAVTISNNSSVDSSTRINFRIFRAPTAAQQAVTPSQTPWKVDATIAGANVSMGTTSVTDDTYTNGVLENSSLTLTNNTAVGSDASTWIGCSSTNSPTGTTCSAGNESVSVSFIPPKSCNAMRVCFNATWEAFSGVATAMSVFPVFAVVKTPTNAQTVSTLGNEKAAVGGITGPATGLGLDLTDRFNVCGTFQTDTSRQMFRLRYVQNIGTAPSSNGLTMDGASGSSGFRNTSVTASCLDDSTPAPLLTGSVVSSATVQNGGPTGVTTVAAGTYTPTLTAGTNSVSPSISGPCTYNRLGDIVTVACQASSGCTTASGTLTIYQVSLPVASNMTTSTDLSGSFSSSVATEVGYITANGTSDTAQVVYFCNNTSPHTQTQVFQYQVK